MAGKFKAKYAYALSMSLFTQRVNKKLVHTPFGIVRANDVSNEAITC